LAVLSVVTKAGCWARSWAAWSVVSMADPLVSMMAASWAAWTAESMVALTVGRSVAWTAELMAGRWVH
jgi:hypothetical protein